MVNSPIVVPSNDVINKHFRPRHFTKNGVTALVIKAAIAMKVVDSNKADLDPSSPNIDAE